MKKIITFVIAFLLCACSSTKPISNIKSTSIEDFYGKEYLKVYLDHKGEYPIKLDYQESYMMYENIDNKDLIQDVFNAMLGIKVGKKTDIDITDAERNYWFTYKDGTTICFMLIKADKDMLIYNPQDKCNYLIDDDNGLFNISIK